MKELRRPALLAVNLEASKSRGYLVSCFSLCASISALALSKPNTAALFTHQSLDIPLVKKEKSALSLTFSPLFFCPFQFHLRSTTSFHVCFLNSHSPPAMSLPFLLQQTFSRGSQWSGCSELQLLSTSASLANSQG